MKVMISFDHDEIHRYLPYAIIGETASREIWSTRKRERLMKEWFSDSERNTCNRIIRDSKKWLLKTGVPENIQMKVSTFGLWKRLADFCYFLG